MKKGKVFAPSKFGEPVVHRFDDGKNSVTAIPEQVADALLLQLLRRFARAMDQLHVKRDESISRIAHEKNDMGPGQFSCRNQIFTANALPQRRFHSLFGEIVREDQTRNVRFMITIRPEREWTASALTKICAEKSPHPGASAFRHRDDDGVAARKFARATAEIPSAKTATSSGIRRLPRNASDFVQKLHVAVCEACQRTASLGQLASA